LRTAFANTNTPTANKAAAWIIVLGPAFGSVYMLLLIKMGDLPPYYSKRIYYLSVK
jgi:hypothetical protein